MSAEIQELESHLKEFRLSSFRPGQREVISAVLDGADCLCIMPTGGGKSLCYQFPAVVRDGVTLVISPLIALMKDQVDGLLELGLRATFINSSLMPAEQHDRIYQMAAGAYDLVYIAPERLRSPAFLEAVGKSRVQLLAIDEAHCISEWGHDFRPDYSRIGQFRRRMGKPQTIALTATATPTVREDIIRQLDLPAAKTFITGFARPNLRFEVQYPSSMREKDQQLNSFLKATDGAGIIYVATRKGCEEIAERLSESLRRRIGIYHGAMLPEDRRKAQEAFMGGKLPIVVATNAFGMGIDKANLRFVVHYNMPGSLEAYYQEAGRAGRDGESARCLLLYTANDRFIQEFFIENNYPSPETIESVYDFLCGFDADPIELTQQELKDRLELSTGTESVRVCEQLLEKCGALERLDSVQNVAGVRLDSDLPTLVDLLPKDAKVRRKVLRVIEGIVGELRHERVFFQPRQLIERTEMKWDGITRALRELNKLEAFDYVPPFRGRAIHMLRRDVAFDELDIDFDELERRRNSEYEKLERVVRYARTRQCRQWMILDYFGDPQKSQCHTCDNCQSGDTSDQNAVTIDSPDDPILKIVQI
ncbi:MAG: RecQ family ATP-dependent DNA helicase, partial [Planctomycetes bacterium]|nr:RecQ family ATP-dependent DNA helicase [Planctomycetota bacterium]